MANQTTTQTSQTCPACKGNKIVAIGNQAQVCPMCGGSGTMPTPGLKYQYAILLSVLGGASAQGNISILNADFRWIYALAYSTGRFLVQIEDSKNSRKFFSVTVPAGTPNQGVPDPMVFGTAQLPFPIQPPYLFNRNGGITISVTDTSGNPNAIWIGFDGQELVPSNATDSSSTSS
jgi:hypothetical protein